MLWEVVLSLPQVHSRLEAASDGVREGGGSPQPVASNLLQHLSPTRIKNIWKVKAPCVRLVGEQKIGKANMHTSPIPTVGLLLPIYVISCAYFKIVRRAGGIVNAITRSFRLAAAGTFPSFLILKKKKKFQWNLRGKHLWGKE